MSQRVSLHYNFNTREKFKEPGYNLKAISYSIWNGKLYLLIYFIII